jgi:hypothetical protein
MHRGPPDHERDAFSGDSQNQAASRIIPFILDAKAQYIDSPRNGIGNQQGHAPGPITDHRAVKDRQKPRKEDAESLWATGRAQ